MGHWDFQFFAFGHFLGRFFGFPPQNFGFSVLVSVAVCGFSFSKDLVFGFRPKYKPFLVSGIRCGFQFFYLDPL